MGYNVIWIDDEWDTRGDSFIKMCKVKHQIYIEPFKTKVAGIAELERNLKYWDAVILDGKAYDKGEDEVANTDGLFAARERLIELRQQKYIPFFVFTRQPDLFEDKMFEKAVGRFYKKDEEGKKKLIEDLKKEVSKSPRFQIKTLYQDALEQLRCISEEACENVIDILEAMHHPEISFTPKLYFNPLRQALEHIFRSANKVSIIPDAFFKKDEVNINQCFMFLKGNNADIIGMRYGLPDERVIPRNIENMMGLIIDLGNEYSHSTKLTDSEIQKAEERMQKEGMNPKYLVFSMALQLCEIASWMNRYITEHPDKEENLKKCVKIEKVNDDELEGVVNVQKIYHIGSKFQVSPVLVFKNGGVGKKVKIVNYGTNRDENLQRLYPFFASNIQLIEE